MVNKGLYSFRSIDLHECDNDYPFDSLLDLFGSKGTYLILKNDATSVPVVKSSMKPILSYQDINNGHVGFFLRS